MNGTMTNVKFVDPEPHGSLLCVHAHPDDETLTTGGLMARWRGAGLPVTLVTCTRGEQGEVIGPDPLGLEGNAVALGAYREIELDRAMSELGVTDFFFLDETAPGVRYVDSGMVWVEPSQGSGQVSVATAAQNVPEGAFSFVELDEAAQLLARVILERQPEFVATYEAGGGYGRPDHVRTHDVVVRALEIVKATTDSRAPALLTAVVPEPIVRRARSAMSSVLTPEELESAVLLPEGGELPLMARSIEQDIVRIDVSGFMAGVRKALAAHATQIQWVTEREPIDLDEFGTKLLGTYALSNNVVAPILSHEFYELKEAGCASA